MFRIGELAKLADVTPDTIRYYEKQQMMAHDVRTEEDFAFIPTMTFSGYVLSAMRGSWASRSNRSASCCRSASILNTIPARNQKGSYRHA